MDTIILIILAILLWSVVRAAVSLAPWVPTYKRNLEQINNLVDLQPGQSFLEIGCGNARVCNFVAKKNPKVKVVGIELAFIFFAISWLRVKISGIKNLEIIYGNALKMDMSEFDVIYVFGMEKSMNNKMRDIVWQQMKPGSRLVSYIFSIDAWPGKEEKIKDEKDGFGVYVYYK
jgi:SAM-dependent methyltransferase